MPITFAQWIQGEMDKRGMNQAEFARAAGVHQSLVSKWTRKESPTIPSSDSIQEMASRLGVSGDLLLEIAGHRKPSRVQSGPTLGERAALEQKLDTMIPAIESFLQDLKRLRGIDADDASAESSGAGQNEKIDHLVNHPLRKQGILVGA